MTELYGLLSQLESQLTTAGLWSDKPPSPESFESTVPFFADKMTFPEWLQWVFVEKIRALMLAGQPLPSPCHIAEMGEVYGMSAPFPAEIVATLKQIDDCINA